MRGKNNLQIADFQKQARPAAILTVLFSRIYVQRGKFTNFIDIVTY